MSQQFNSSDKQQLQQQGLTKHYVIKLLLCLGFILMTGLVNANPPRVLSTSFDEYAKQQQRHDQALSQAQTVSRSNAQDSTRQNKGATIKASATIKHSATQSSRTSATSGTVVDINTADEASLIQALNGVGPAKAKAIIEYRQSNGRFKTADDLLAVKGIGPATLNKNRANIRVN